MTLLGKRRWSGELGLSDEEMERSGSAGPGWGWRGVDVSRPTWGWHVKLRMLLLLLGFLTFTWKPRFPGHSHSLFVFAVFSPPGPSHIPERAKCTARQGPREQGPDVWGRSHCRWPLRKGELTFQRHEPCPTGRSRLQSRPAERALSSVCCVVSLLSDPPPSDLLLLLSRFSRVWLCATP